MDLLAIAATIALLISLIVWLKLHPFIAFLIASLFAGFALKLPADQIPGIIEQGIGNTLGGLVGIVCLGAMFGKLIAVSGAAQKIANVLIQFFGQRMITWALMLTGFIVGIPLFYNVGFVLLVPLVFSVVYRSKLPAVYLGIPLLAALSVTHGFLPPHPSPTAMVPMFNADIGTTLLLGLLVAVPTMIVAGPLFAMTLKNIQSKPLETFLPAELKDTELPSTWNSFITALLPVVLIASSVALPKLASNEQQTQLLQFISNPLVVMLLALLVATYTLGIKRGTSVTKLMVHYGEAVKDIALIVLIVAGAGALKQVFIASGVSQTLAELLNGVDINPLLLGWLIATIIRICLGSATVAGLTAAGIMAPVVAATGANPNLMILAIGAGSLMCSHVNDSGFWMYKEYFNLSLKQTLMSWTVMESIVGVVGIVGVLVINGLIT
ncbi:gluconate:H+ symporter [Gilvimarinus sp. SDUM040013]|uniref:Gluconate:H+ symporter n=1 Tax=Gilvimarinus gilvus TaxID=3058038 RepID=A0ABU4RX08_9GAMM|nr:gluconate:H+ symporter [Gilvimarinus sp. SDUM040013]MDO3385216.1 gluconate:H+ symporter [Gilvimarinus sp. SDUM040013]MDX6849199.1 gluconate:H+ symporter [Gilvimarinus sp. SDUM040013]